MSSEKENDKTKLKVGTVEIVFTALLTSLLTLGTSYFIMSSQLEKEQKYWADRMKRERLQELNDRQIQLFEEVNEEILLSEVLVKDYKLEAAKFMSFVNLVKISPENKNDFDANNLNEKAVEYHKLINKLGAKLQMVELYFSDKVDSLITPLSESLTKNYNNNLLLGNNIITEKMTSIEDYFNYDFETIKELTDNRLKILGAMRNDINEIATKIYEAE